MRADLIDVSLEDYGHSVLITLRGTFTSEQIPALREKLGSITGERRRTYLMDLEHCQFRDASYLELFLDLLNQVQGRESRLAFIFSQEENWQFFRRWSNVFEIHASLEDFSRSGLIDALRRRGIAFSKRTGVRLSTGMALFLAIVLAGWILSLVSMVRFQESELRLRERQILQLEDKQRVLIRNLQDLRSAVGPLRDLGLLEARNPGQPRDSLQIWIDYLETLEKKRKDSAVEAAPTTGEHP
jgi:anti-anti-sigma regulatory factor